MNRVALVTGAGSGIGSAIAAHLATCDYQVIVSDVSIESAQKMVDAIVEKGGNAEACELNVTSAEHIDHAIKQAGRIDVLVNNAGIQHVSRLDEFPVDRWKLITEILLTGPAMMTRAALPLMREQGFGRIINIGSIHSIIASPFKSAYVAAKHGLIGFSKVVALETADTDITINTICPSYVKTPLVEQQIKNQAKEHGITEEEVIQEIMLAPMPKKSFIDTQEIAETVDYLISPGAKNMTGQTIILDGGWTAR
ncbi:MAG: 3-hydroxybutyrate dehydrogenase [Cellvibrionaceae bacterium]